MKKTISILLLLLLLMSFSFSTEKNIPDLENHWAKNLIMTNINEGRAILEDDLFYPDKELSLGEVVKYINIYMGYSDGTYGNDEKWYKKEANLAVAKGYIRNDQIYDYDEYFEPATRQDVIIALNSLISIKEQAQSSTNFSNNRALNQPDGDIMFTYVYENTEDLRVINYLQANILSLDNGNAHLMDTVKKAEFYKIMYNVFGDISTSSTEMRTMLKTSSNLSIDFSNPTILNQDVNSDIILLPSVSGEVLISNTSINGNLYILSSDIDELKFENSKVNNIIYTAGTYKTKNSHLTIDDSSVVIDTVFIQQFVSNVQISDLASVGKIIHEHALPDKDIYGLRYIIVKVDSVDSFDDISNYIYNTSKRSLVIYLTRDKEVHFSDSSEYNQFVKDPPIKVIDGENYTYRLSHSIWQDGQINSNDFHNNVSGIYLAGYQIEDDEGRESNRVYQTIYLDYSAGSIDEAVGSITTSKNNSKPKSVEEVKNKQKQSETDLLVNGDNQEQIEDNNINKRIAETFEELSIALKQLPSKKDNKGNYEFYNDFESAIQDVEDCIYILENYYNVDKETITCLEYYDRLQQAKETLASWQNEIDVEYDEYATETKESFKSNIIFWLDKLPADDELAKKTTDIDRLIESVGFIEESIEYFQNWEGDFDEILNLNTYYRLAIAKERIRQINDMSSDELELVNKMNRKLQHYEQTTIIPSGKWYREILNFRDQIESLSEKERNFLNDDSVLHVYDYIENAPDFAIAEYEFQNNREEFFDYLEDDGNKIFIPKSMNTSYQREYRNLIEEKILLYVNKGTFNYEVASHGYNGSDPTQYLAVLVDKDKDIELSLAITTKQLFDYEDKSRYFGQ